MMIHIHHPYVDQCDEVMLASRHLRFSRLKFSCIVELHGRMLNIHRLLSGELRGESDAKIFDLHQSILGVLVTLTTIAHTKRLYVGV